jgi:hypothetical protein
MYVYNIMSIGVFCRGKKLPRGDGLHKRQNAGVVLFSRLSPSRHTIYKKTSEKFIKKKKLKENVKL